MKSSTVFYTGCTEENFWETLVIMRSIKGQNPGAECYVLAKYLSKKAQRLLKKYHLIYKRIDIAEYFSREWQNPLVDYLVFAGQECLPTKGVETFIYIGTRAITIDVGNLHGVNLLNLAAKTYAQRLKDRLPDLSSMAILGEIKKVLKAGTIEPADEYSFTEEKVRTLYKKYYPLRWLASSQRVENLKNQLHEEEAPSGKTVKTYWYRNDVELIRNFGDEMPKDLLPKLCGRPVKLAPIEKCELITVGSILEVAAAAKKQRTVKVWGSGFIAPGKNDDLAGLEFYAVRGSKTKERVGKSLPMGDPGILANIIYPKSRRRNGLVGVVVHYVDYNSPLVRKLRKDERFLVINTLDAPARVAAQISACKLILSSSLHGLIFADSYKIPNRHLRFSNKLTGGDYKFEDYYGGNGRKHRLADKAKIFDDDYLEMLIREYEPVKNLRKKQKELITSLPL